MNTRYSFRNHPARQRWRLGLTTLACAGLLASASAQNVGLYSFASSGGGTLQDMTGASTLLGSGQDDAASAVTNIGFSLNYEGINYTQFSINSNGGMKLGGVQVSAYAINYNLTSNPLVLLPYSGDGTSSTGNVTTVVTGSSPNQVRVVQWNVGMDYNALSANCLYQVWLYEGTNVIEFRYGTGAPTGSFSGGMQVAITGANAANYLNVLPGLTASSSNTTLFSTSNGWPGNGTSLTFSPPAACTTPAPGTTLAAGTSGCPGFFTSLSLQNNTPGSGVSYQWQSSPNGVDTWTNVGSSIATYNTGALLATTWFQCLVTCSTGPSTVASTPVQITISSPAPTYQVFSGTQITETFASWGDRCSTTDVPSIAGNSWTNSPAYGPGTWRRDDQGASAGWNNTSGGFFAFNNGASQPVARFHSRQGGAVGGTLDFHVDMSAGTGGELLRFEYMYSAGNGGNLQVLVSTDGGGTFSALGSPLGGTALNTWVAKEFTIASTSATTVIRLRGQAGAGATGNDIGVDNFRILPAPTCAKPTALAAIGAGPGDVQLTWNCTNCTGSYIMEYGPTGFVPGTGATAGVNGTVMTATGSPATLTSVPAGNYDVYVRQDCGASDFSENSTKTTFSIVAGDFCSNAIDLATAPHGDWSAIGSTAGAGNDYTTSACGVAQPGGDVVFFHDVEAGATLSLGVWSSVNRMSIAYGGGCPGTTSLACANVGGYLALGGNVQLVNDYETLIWTNNGCATERVYVLADVISSGGDVYIFNYAYTPATGTVCNAVTGTSVNTVNSGTGATVSWNATCSSNEIVEYGLSGFTPGTGALAGVGGTVVAVSGTSTVLSGLTLDVAYDVYVRQDCGSGNFSTNGAASTFTVHNGDDCTRVIALSGTTGVLGINTTGTNNDISVCGTGNTGGDLVMSYSVAPGYGIYFTSTPVGPYAGQVRISYGSSCPGVTELYCAPGATDYMWLNETGAEQTVYFIQDGTDEGATTVEWTYFPECATLDTDGDGINDCDDSCINFPGQVGDPCTSGGLSGTISADCQCVTACTGNEVVVVINTDYNPTETTWEITNMNNVVIATGGPTAAQEHMQVSQTACVGTTLENGCYGFRLMDSYGDGINNGSWQLRSTSGKLLLGDDFANGTRSPSSTPANASYTEHSFCLPAGNSNIAAKSCGIMNSTMNSLVYASIVSGATSYQFEFSNPDAGFIRRIAVPNGQVRYNQMVTSPLTPGVKYFARVRTNAAGAIANAHFGGGCELGMTSTIPCTELISAPTYGHSCNETRSFNTNNSFIYALPVVGATEYQFRITIPGEIYDQTFIRSTYILQLKWNTSVAPPLVNGSTYNVQVNVKVGTVYSGFCGNTCSITIDNSGNRPEASMEQANGTATMWPNPVRDGQVNLSIDGIQDADQNITIDIQDIYGKQVFAKEFGNSGERFNTILDLPNGIASGVYMVNITVNGQTTVQRLSIIK